MGAIRHIETLLPTGGASSVTGTAAGSFTFTGTATAVAPVLTTGRPVTIRDRGHTAAVFDHGHLAAIADTGHVTLAARALATVTETG